jgi:outer membrane protein W
MTMRQHAGTAVQRFTGVSMKFVYSFALVALVFAARPAHAQETSDSDRLRDAPLRRYMAAFGGMADIGSETIPTLAGEYGESITKNAQAYANFSYFDNVMTDQMRDNLIAASNSVEQITGVRRTFSGRDRGLALTFGGKFVAGRTVRPYVGAGLGGMQIRRTITEATLGDITQAFAAQSGLGDGVITTGATKEMKPLGEVVVGVGFVSRHTYVDIGYRYRRAFHTAIPVEFSQVVAGIGAKW